MSSHAGLHLLPDVSPLQAYINEQVQKGVDLKALDKMALERLLAAQDEFQLAKAVAIAQHVQWRIDRCAPLETN